LIFDLGFGIFEQPLPGPAIANQKSKIENSLMGHRRDHYEDAFEDFLRARQCPYVAVDEAKKKAFAAVQLKNFDFVVYSASGQNLLVDIKGRKFPDTAAVGRRRQGRPWENWVTREDIQGLEQWQQVFGAGFRAVLVFAYWLQGAPDTSPFQDVHVYRGNHYIVAASALDDYLAGSKPRSAKWQTLTMPTAQFKQLARPVEEML